MERLARIEVTCEAQSEKLDNLCTRLLGNGGDGLVVDVDRLKQTSKRHTKWLGVFVPAVLATFGAVVVWWVTSTPVGP